MKTIILYATKHGAAREIAQRIAAEIEGAVVHDLKQSGDIDISEYDRVILGSSLYAGSIRKEAKAFLAQNKDALKMKRPGLFLCGLDAGNEEKYFKDNFLEEILQTAETTGFLGGIFDPQKVGMPGRLIMKAASGVSKYTDAIENGKIESFAAAMKG